MFSTQFKLEEMENMNAYDQLLINMTRQLSHEING